METDFISLKELKYCIRTKHSEDMPLKRPRMNCAFLEGKECSFHPAHIKYLNENLIGNIYARHRHETRLSLKFRCILFDSDGLTTAERKDYNRAFLSIQKEELKQCKKDSKVLDYVKKLVTVEFFEDIEYELDESDHWINLRIVDKPEGNLQKAESCFKVYVDQHSVGDSGNSYAGTVCIELPNKKYLIWDYWM